METTQKGIKFNNWQSTGTDGIVGHERDLDRIMARLPCRLSWRQLAPWLGAAVACCGLDDEFHNVIEVAASLWAESRFPPHLSSCSVGIV